MGHRSIIRVSSIVHKLPIVRTLNWPRVDGGALRTKQHGFATDSFKLPFVARFSPQPCTILRFLSLDIRNLRNTPQHTYEPMEGNQYGRLVDRLLQASLSYTRSQASILTGLTATVSALEYFTSSRKGFGCKFRQRRDHLRGRGGRQGKVGKFSVGIRRFLVVWYVVCSCPPPLARILTLLSRVDHRIFTFFFASPLSRHQLGFASQNRSPSEAMASARRPHESGSLCLVGSSYCQRLALYARIRWKNWRRHNDDGGWVRVYPVWQALLGR